MQVILLNVCPSWAKMAKSLERKAKLRTQLSAARAKPLSASKANIEAFFEGRKQQLER